MNKLSVSECVRFGWDTFKKSPWLFVGALAILLAISFASSFISGAVNASHNGLVGFAMFLISIALGTYIEMAMISFLLKAHESTEGITFKSVLTSLPFWKYLGAKILVSAIVAVGFVLLIVPGVILMLMFLMTQYIVIDRSLGPIEALKESNRITKGHKAQLLLLVLAVAGLNILGALALLVGLFVSVPVSMLAIVHAYRTLEHKANEVVPAYAPSSGEARPAATPAA